MFVCLFVFPSARNKSANQKPAGNFKMALPLSEEDKFVFVEMLLSNPWRTATTRNTVPESYISIARKKDHGMTDELVYTLSVERW